jgi:uncharacterized phage protein (TIGR02220 family)
MKVSIQEDMWEVMRALPGEQGGRLAAALVEYGFTGEEPEACPDPWYFAFLAFRGRIELSARQSAGGSKGASGRWGREGGPGGEAGEASARTHGDGAVGDVGEPSAGVDGCGSDTHDGCRADTHDGCAMGTHETPTMGVCVSGRDTHDAESESEKESERKDNVGHGEDAKVRDASARFVGRLNELAGTSFSPDSAQTLRLVSGRLRDGHTAEELCEVAEVKSGQWLRKPDMRGYLRPQTLLRASNFEGYLQEAARVRGRASPFAAYDVEPDAVIGGEA